MLSSRVVARVVTRVAATALVSLLAMPIAASSAEAQAPVGNTISYQGHLKKNNAPYDGVADFRFRLFDSEAGGLQIAGDLNFAGMNVSDGIFTVALDFGAGAFAGEARWLEIAAKTAGDADLIPLSPRQAVRPSPYAVYALGSPGSWTSGANGIEHLGNVGIGGAAAAEVQLYVNSGTSNENALTVTNNNADWAALAVANAATNGWGVYDAVSDRHYFGGRIGVGVDPLAKIHADSWSETAVIGRNFGGWVGVYGEAQSYHGVWGNSITGSGVVGTSGGAYNTGVYGESTHVLGTGGWFKNTGGGVALLAEGVAKVASLEIYGGSDIVEGFETGEKAIEPGTVLVIDERHPGELRESTGAYDSRVAGVVSGAGGIEPGLRLGQKGVLDGKTPVAMTGRVYVRCSAENGPVRPGDRLTTAAIAGHAMRADDPARSQGSVLGKAMSSLEQGTGLVLVLVNLQ